MRNEPVILVTVTPEGSKAARVELSDRILGFEYEDCENKADKLKLRVDNWDLSNFDDPIWRKGNLIEVSWGYAEAMAPTRKCQIRKVSGFQELSVEAHGLEVTLNTQVRSRVFESMTRSEVVRKIAEEWGYRSDDVQHIEDTEVVRETIVQARLTDAQFVRRLAHKEGFEWFIDFDGFHFHQRDLAQRPLRTFEWTGVDADDREILSINVENDVTAKPGTVRAKSRDPVKRRTIDISASVMSELTRSVLGAIVEAPGTDSPPVPGFQNIAHEEVVPTTETTEAGAQRHAAGRFRRAQQVAVKMSMEIVGDPNLLAKSVVEVRGVGKRLSQSYYVKEVKHSIKGGYKCSVTMVSDGSKGHSTRSVRAQEASAIQVGPRMKGRRGLPAADVARRTLDVDPKVLRALTGKDADGQDVTKYQDQRHREPPNRRGFPPRES
jgi:phage protein D